MKSNVAYILFSFLAVALLSLSLSAGERHRERGRHRVIQTPRGTIERERGRYRTRTFTPHSSDCAGRDRGSCN